MRVSLRRRRECVSADRSDDGSATVTVLALSCVLVLLALVLVALGVVAISRHRAASAADLGALAAARRVVQGEAAACAGAGRVVSAAGATMLTCRVEGTTALVSVRVVPEGPLGRLGGAHARAAAGPASSPASASQTSRSGSVRGGPHRA